jgi:3-methylfumaryl-CoA hydratase
MDQATDFSAWVGRQRVSRDTVALDRARGLAATLDRDASSLRVGDALPTGWHWIYFHEPVPRSALAGDGHEARGDFLPPVPLPRRMWAGGRVRAERPLVIGSEVERTSTVRSVEQKEGSSGPLAFVTVEHRLVDDEGVALVEEQNIVYVGLRPASAGRPRTGPEAPVDEGWRSLGRFTADEVALFRFSALTFNGHRIHYDWPFATQTEGYPGLVVHGPLLALLLLGAGVDLLGGVGGVPASGTQVDFRYRALQPLFCGEVVELLAEVARAGGGGREVELRNWHAERGAVTSASLRLDMRT